MSLSELGLPLLNRPRAGEEAFFRHSPVQGAVKEKKGGHRE